jgi:hypothetical protein
MPGPRLDMSGLSALSDLVVGFQRYSPDMSDPQARHVWLLSHIRTLSQIPKALAGYVWPPGETYPTSQPFPELTKYIQLPGRISEAFPGHVWLSSTPIVVLVVQEKPDYPVFVGLKPWTDLTP